MARILLIDDKPEDRDEIRAVLESHGHSVESCGTEANALHRLDASRFQLALLDLDPPRKGGGTLLVEIVRRFPDLRVLVTARGGETISSRDYLQVADARGTVRTLAKPFTRRRLAQAVRVMLEGGEWIRNDDEPGTAPTKRSILQHDEVD